MRLKSHESPRAQGRNHRGRGGSARKRQIDKRNRALLQRLQAKQNPSSVRFSTHSHSAVRQAGLDPVFFCLIA